jgi:hypothetical protein
LLSIATLIDPRFKTIHFQKPLAKSNVLQIVNKEIRQMISAENVYVSNSRYLKIIKFSNFFFNLVYYVLISG